MPGPLMSAYYATKSYVLNLSVALAEELRRKSKKSGVKNKVRICTLCPGPVNTDFDSRAGVAFSLPSMSSEKVAKYAVDNALKGKTVIIPGALIKLVSVLSSCFPKTVSAMITYTQQERKMSNV
jgi:short-subunit dehydrogenase